MVYSESDRPSEPAEVYEHIPWAELAVPVRDKKPWVIYLVAGAIVVGSLAALGARSIDRTPELPAGPGATPLPVRTVDALPQSPPTTPQEALSEADLLAATPGRGEIAAAARAEWFVSDYFSSGGDPASSPGVVDALPEGAPLPVPADPRAATYVDWVATSRIEALGKERFRSTVLFRVLLSGDDGSYVRLPVQAVDVVVEVDPAGGTRVLDLPMPVALPTGPEGSKWAAPSDEVPDSISAAALRLAGLWGTGPTVIEAAEQTGEWRVVIGVADEAGVRWPLTIWLTADGDPASDS